MFLVLIIIISRFQVFTCIFEFHAIIIFQSLKKLKQRIKLFNQNSKNAIKLAEA